MSISKKLSHNGQMSEAFCTAMFLSLSGGLQDVYTYLYRGKVFANAQTGNIVLCGVKLVEGDWGAVLHYLVPLCFFALGVFAAELLRQKFRQMQRLHWRQLVVSCRYSQCGKSRCRHGSLKPKCRFSRVDHVPLFGSASVNSSMALRFPFNGMDPMGFMVYLAGESASTSSRSLLTRLSTPSALQLD